MERIDLNNKALIMRDKLASEGFYFSVESCIMQVISDEENNARTIRQARVTSTCEMCGTIKHTSECLCEL